MNSVRIAHISDIHYNPGDFSHISTMLREKGLDVEEHLERCLKSLSGKHPDILLVTGDLTHEGDAGAYRYLKEQFDSLLPGVPVLCTMGNHDIRSAFREGFLEESVSGENAGAPYQTVLSVKGFRFISLDSAYERGLEGFLSDDSLDYLEDQLLRTPARGAFLLVHHPVMAAAGPMSLMMTERLSRLLGSGKITGIFTGHVHGSYTASVCGVPQFTADSLKTGCDLLNGALAYNDRAGYEFVSFDRKGDWLAERFLVRPRTDVFFTKPF